MSGIRGRRVRFSFMRRVLESPARACFNIGLLTEGQLKSRISRMSQDCGETTHVCMTNQWCLLYVCECLRVSLSTIKPPSRNDRQSLCVPGTNPTLILRRIDCRSSTLRCEPCPADSSDPLSIVDIRIVFEAAWFYFLSHRKTLHLSLIPHVSPVCSTPFRYP